MPSTISQDNLLRHLQVLTEDIGVRLAGTPGEQAAADYLVAQAEAMGLDVYTETFPVNARVVEEEHLEVRLGDTWESFPCSLFSNTPGTDGNTVDAPLVFFEAPSDYLRDDLSFLRGKIVLHLGTHIESREQYRRLIEAEPAGILMTDVRYPGDTPLTDGMFPAYTRDIGAVPTLNIAFQDAWRWKEDGADHARFRVVGGMVPGRESQNVVIELPGSDLEAGVLYVGGHHDTQADSVGADDNGTGTVAVLELARVLAPLPRRRTIRLICFGAEEQLSVGSAEYVRRHRDELAEHGKLMLNFDSYGSLLGWTEFILNGPPELEMAIQRTFQAHGEYSQILNGTMPYADHFPFVAAGVPGITVWRLNCTSGRFFHHRPDDEIHRLSLPKMASLLDASAIFLDEVANADELPFPTTIPENQRHPARHFWDDLFGGW